MVKPPKGNGKPKTGQVTGRVHNGSRGKVELRLEHRRKGSWRRVAVGHDHVGGRGKFAKSLRFTRGKRLKHGSYRLQAHYLGSAEAKPSTSRYRRFRISSAAHRRAPERGPAPAARPRPPVYSRAR